MEDELRVFLPLFEPVRGDPWNDYKGITDKRDIRICEKCEHHRLYLMRREKNPDGLPRFVEWTDKGWMICWTGIGENRLWNRCRYFCPLEMEHLMATEGNSSEEPKTDK